MKGITHFAVGIAAASCVPGVVRAATEGSSLPFVLGGMFGLLPDTIDFKFARFIAKHDIVIVPDPNDLDPQVIANGLACAFERAHMSGKPVRVRLSTVRVGPDEWQQYLVKFDPAQRSISVTSGPVVTTGQIPTARISSKKTATARVPCPIRLDYLADNTVDIFEGPLFCLRPTGDGAVLPEFIPWHRRWSHSLVVGLFLGLVAWPALGPMNAAVISGAWCLHALVDQCGYLGCSLFYPLQRKRLPGWQFTRSGDGRANFAVLWSALLLTFWNLCRHSQPPVPCLSLPQLLVLALVAPMMLLAWFARILKRR